MTSAAHDRWPSNLEGALRESERKYRELVRTLHVAVCTCNAEGYLTLFNEAAVELWGRAPKVGETMWCGSHCMYRPDGSDLALEESPMAIALKERRPLDAEAVVGRPDGTRRYVLAHPRPFYDADGTMVGAVNILVDITDRKIAEREADRAREALRADIEERKRIEEALRETNHNLEATRAQLETITDTMSAAVAHIDDRGCYLWANPNYAARLNCKREALTGKSMEEVLGAEVWAIKRPFVERVLSGEKVEYEALLPFNEHGPRWYHSIYSPIRGEPSMCGNWVAVINDITHHKEMEEALREVDRRKDEFLAVLAHELRNPLAPIRMALQIMQMTAGDEEVQVGARDVISRQLAQLVRLVDDLLDVSRISHGKITLRQERVELRTVLDYAVEMSKPLLDAARHRLTITLPADRLCVNADLTRMSQVFSNLLSNAGKYTAAGGNIELRVDPNGSTVAVSIKDNGVGISPAMLGQVFDMFTQVDRSLDRGRGGLGIGLSIAKRLVEMHGGSIEAHSAGLEQGSEFVVTLPLAPVRAETSRQHSASAPAATADSRRVLVVDDNEDAADSLAAVLQLMGNDVRIAHDGQQAFALAESFRPEIILLDIGMPGLTGHEVCRRIRDEEWGKAIVIAALTGWSQEADRRMSRDSGFDHHLVKPVDMASLSSLLDREP